MTGPEVMLASPSKDPVDQVLDQLVRNGWWFELKFDGIRAVIHRSAAGVVTITNRRRLDITHRYPDVVAAWADVPFTGVLDGEIIVMRHGRPDFEGAHLRDAQSTAGRIRALAKSDPATFMFFDVLNEAGTDVRALAYERRREILAGVDAPGLSLGSQDGRTMWEFVLANKLEGLVAKRGDAAYRAGRHTSWVKLKHTKRVSALVGGIQAGKGSRGPVGSLLLYLFDTDTAKLVSIGRVGSGISEADTHMLAGRVARGQITVVEVEYLDVSSSHQLRMPVYRGLRTDVAAEECVLSSLAVA